MYTPSDSERLPPILAGLCVIKVMDPDLYAKAKKGALSYAEANAALHLEAPALPGEERHREWTIEQWKYATDANLDDAIVQKIASATARYGIGDRSSWIPFIANEVIDQMILRQVSCSDPRIIDPRTTGPSEHAPVAGFGFRRNFRVKQVGEARRKNANLAALCKSEPRCVYCASPPATVEHMPPIGCFKFRRRPKGMEFASCKRCNEGTRGADLVASFFCRLSRAGDMSIVDEAVARKRKMRQLAPGVLEELFGRHKEEHLWIRDRGRHERERNQNSGDMFLSC
jgi:hypothetical protein